MEANLSQTHCPLFKRLQRHIWRANTYSALSFDQINFFNEFRKCVIVSVSQLNLSYSDTCQMTFKALVLHLFPVPQTGSHIINILFASLFFGPYCKLRILGFFDRYMALSSINRWKKNLVRNLQQGSKTRLIRKQI